MSAIIISDKQDQDGSSDEAKTGKYARNAIEAMKGIIIDMKI